MPDSGQLLLVMPAAPSSHISQFYSSLAAPILKYQSLTYPQTFLHVAVYVFTLW